MEEWKTRIVEKLKCIKGLVSKNEENQKAIKKNFEDIARQIHKSFPQFWGNLCQIMLDRKKLIIDSGLKKRAERVMKEIEVENPSITYNLDFWLYRHYVWNLCTYVLFSTISRY